MKHGKFCRPSEILPFIILHPASNSNNNKKYEEWNAIPVVVVIQHDKGYHPFLGWITILSFEKASHSWMTSYVEENS
jgi:hypothetical protein